MPPHARQDDWLDPALRLQPGQQELTPAQEAEARRFAEASIRRQLSTEPVDEQETEALLCQAYAVAGLAPPQRILWMDGPLQLVAVLAPPGVEDSLASVWDRVVYGVAASVATSVEDRVGKSVWNSVWNSVATSVGDRVWDNMWDSVRLSVWDSIQASVRASVWDRVTASVGAYWEAARLACCYFFDVYLAPNDVHALAHFNELVSGYWLGQDVAVLVRRPKLLSRDAEGWLHSATGKCLEYRDGWGCYAWHGVQVPERVILKPETLTREDFLNEQDVEVRRVIQERMGQRFVAELGGILIDSGPRGTLYEVALPEIDPYDEEKNDPERVARYVQVQDASTPRQYFLRVPPGIQTAAEAVAWSFGLPVKDYRPEQET